MAATKKAATPTPAVCVEHDYGTKGTLRLIHTTRTIAYADLLRRTKVGEEVLARLVDRLTRARLIRCS